MTRVITYGTFDLLHHGHINLLQRARELGDHLTVALSTDEFNAGKGKQCLHGYEYRRAILEAIRYVDHVIPESSWEQKVRDVQKHAIDIFCIGDDWTGHFDFLEAHCRVVYLSRTPGVSTTAIKDALRTGDIAEL
jgi:glycerol-3-phosphate cytidylyltransferase